jgi:hypothetical protein
VALLCWPGINSIESYRRHVNGEKIGGGGGGGHWATCVHRERASAHNNTNINNVHVAVADHKSDFLDAACDSHIQTVVMMLVVVGGGREERAHRDEVAGSNDSQS